jgi:hypothetical protein
MLVSSAYYNSLEPIFIPNGKSLMYSKNNNGLTMEPCGTPFFKFSQPEEVLPGSLCSI